MQFYKSFFPNETILHIACESKNIDLVKYIISLKKIDVKSKTVFLCLFLNAISNKEISIMF